MLAITVPFLEKFACVVAGKIIGLSRHPDYFEYHYRLRDLKKIRIEGLSKFIRVNGQGQVESIVLAEALRAKDTKAAVLPTDSLSDEEMAVVFSAIELVNQPEAAAPCASVEAESQTEVTDAEPSSTPVTQASATKRTKKKPRSKPARRATASTASD